MPLKKISRNLERYPALKDFDTRAAHDVLARLESGEKEPVRDLILQLPALLSTLDHAIEQTETRAQLAERALEMYTASLRDSNAKLQELNQTIHSMVNSLREGFIVFHQDGVCRDIFSQRACEFLGEEPFNKSICDVLMVPEPDRAGFMEWFRFLFSPGADFTEIAALGPSTIDHPSLHLTVNFRPIFQDDRVTAVVMILQDFTAEKKALAEAEEMRSYSGMLTRLFADRENFMRILDLIRIQIDELTNWRIKSLSDHESVLRVVHNLKSYAGSISARTLKKAAHEAETALLLEWSRSRLPGEFEVMIHTAADMLKKSFDEFINEYRSLFGFYQGHSTQSRSIPFDVLLQFYNQIKKSGSPQLQAEFEKAILFTPLRDLIKDLRDHTLSAARSTNKEIEVITVFSATERVFAPPYQTLFDSLFHLLNNSVDHGIEPAATRQHLNKSTVGKITIEADVNTNPPGHLKISIVDDGRGINPADIRKRLLQKGVDSSLESDEEVIYHIFEPGFSTASAVSEMSGRGIGMDAVLFQVKKLGGSIQLSSKPGHGTRIDITLPYLSPDMEAKGEAA